MNILSEEHDPVYILAGTKILFDGHQSLVAGEVELLK
jgi:hypothetical protein